MVIFCRFKYDSVMKIIFLVAIWNFGLTLQSLIYYVEYCQTLNFHTLAVIIALLLLFTLNGTYLAYLVNPHLPKRKRSQRNKDQLTHPSDHPSRNATQTITLPEKK